MSKLRHFLTLLDFSPVELTQIIQRATEMKRQHLAGEDPQAFPGTVLAMIFAKSSTRTRVSFEAGMAQLGGHAMFLSPQDTQLGRGEPIEDSARIISSMVDIVMIRTFGHDIVERFAAHSSVPVINALTDDWAFESVEEAVTDCASRSPEELVAMLGYPTMLHSHAATKALATLGRAARKAVPNIQGLLNQPEYEPPINAFGSFVLEERDGERGTFDVKGVLAQIVDFARLRALQHGMERAKDVLSDVKRSDH